jgi:2-C-methyl-D-erythritol 4-phosphate cytidylyltransferase
MASGKNKVFLTLGRRPIVFYAIAAFEKRPEIGSIVVTARNGEIDDFQNIVRKFGFKKVRAVIPGGAMRQDSAFNALEYLNASMDTATNPVVVFHNGANPFVTAEEIGRSIEGARKHGSCVVAHRSKDTIKEVDDDGMVAKTLDRKNLWNMQTPQAIQFRLAHAAFRRARLDGYVGTDDVSLVERIGKKVKVIEGSAFNFKITYPIDLALAKLLLQKKYV